jgi:hypothetical protein
MEETIWIAFPKDFQDWCKQKYKTETPLKTITYIDIIEYLTKKISKPLNK